MRRSVRDDEDDEAEGLPSSSARVPGRACAPTSASFKCACAVSAAPCDVRVSSGHTVSAQAARPRCVCMRVYF